MNKDRVAFWCAAALFIVMACAIIFFCVRLSHASPCQWLTDPSVQEGYVTCCCTTYQNTTCCAETTFCGGYVPGCICRY